MYSFFWLYLTANAADFQLILLDRNTLRPNVAHKPEFGWYPLSVYIFMHTFKTQN